MPAASLAARCASGSSSLTAPCSGSTAKDPFACPPELVPSWKPPVPAWEAFPAQVPKVRRLAAEGEWIRTFSSAPDGQRFRSFVRDRPDRLSAQGLIRAVAGFAEYPD